MNVRTTPCTVRITSTMLLVILWCSILIFLVYLYLNQAYGYWKKRNIPHRKPNLFLGNLTESIFMKKTLGQTYTDIYNEFPGFPYVGVYKIRQPGIMINEPEIIQQLLIKDFHHFDENDFKVDENIDPIAAKNPFFQSGDKWKITRSQLTHCFTSGKMKSIIPLMVKVGDDLVKYLDDNRKSGNISFETKELVTKFTTDNVASCAFGLEGKSFVEEDADFRKIVKMTLNPSTTVVLKMMMTMFFPSLATFLKTKFIPDEAENYFRSIVSNTLEYRLKNNIVRNDFLDIINELRNTQLNYTIDDVLGHALSFLGDGTETSALTLSFTLFELAANGDVQDNARDEINKILGKHHGKITYESLQEMTYLDCCIQESLRIHPPALFLMKLCTKPYELDPINGNTKKLRIDVGTPIIIPLHAIQMDEKYFQEPRRFNPDRFSEENKSSITKCSFIPFGNGPRVCIGQRFAILQIKVAIVAIIKNFDIRLSEKMKLPLEYNPKYFMLISKDGLWLDYHRRNV